MQVRKRFGQHFLHDKNVVRRIVDAVAPEPGERIVEIRTGPRNALTWDLLQRSKELDVIEIDRDLAAALRADGRAGDGLKVHVQDALKMDFLKLRNGAAPLRIVGNLPYNISTPLLFRLLEQSAAIADMHFMLQKEVVDRMTAKPSTKEYGRLTVMLAAVADTQRMFDVGPGAFQPKPKVWSSIVRITPMQQPRFALGHEGALRQVVSAAFSARRKTLRNGFENITQQRTDRSLRHEIHNFVPKRSTPSGAIRPARTASFSQLYSNTNGRV